MLDQPSTSIALWRIYAQTGIRPEYLLPVLQVESGLDPSRQNSQGYDYWGINQLNGPAIRARGVDPKDYLTWPASRQLNEFVLPYMGAQVKSFGPLKSGTKVYQANFYPASLVYAKTLDGVILRKPNRDCVPKDKDPYCANKGFDSANKGYITVGDLAAFVKRAAGVKAVKDAIAAAYAERPEESQHDPTLGDDFSGGAPPKPGTIVLGSSSSIMPTLIITTALVAAGGAAALYLRGNRRFAL